MPGHHLVSSPPPGLPRPVSPKVQTAIRLLIRGQDGDPDCRPLTLFEAAAAVGMKPWSLRKAFYQPTVVAHLRRERRAFIAILTAANPAALARIRDRAANTIAQLGAIKQLDDELAETITHRSNAAESSPHMTIQIINQVAPPAPTTVIDVQPEPERVERRDAAGYRIDEHGNRVFEFNPYR
jgi:hypothetical protein